MKRKLLVWGVTLTVGGWLLFRMRVFKVIPALRNSTDPQGIWAGMTVSQKLTITGLELPFFAGLLCLLLSLVLHLAVAKK